MRSSAAPLPILGPGDPAAAAGARGPDTAARALVHGYATAAGWAAGILLAAAVFAAVLINAPRPIRQGHR